MNWYLEAWKKYAVFSGRACRAEYWMFSFWNLIIGFGLAAIDMFVVGTSENSIGVLYGIYSLSIIIPSFAVTARRLHDTNRSGWWMFVSLVPVVGTIALFVFLLQESKPGADTPNLRKAA